MPPILRSVLQADRLNFRLLLSTLPPIIPATAPTAIPAAIPFIIPFTLSTSVVFWMMIAFPFVFRAML